MTDTSIITRHGAAVNDALRGLLADSDLLLYRMMAYQLGWVDERGRAVDSEPPPRALGSMVLEVASVAGVPGDTASLPAAAVELLLSSCQVHEDVADGNAERRGRPSVPGIWGLAQATNAGDGMHAVARLALFDLRGRGVPSEAASACLEALDRAAVQLLEGEYRGRGAPAPAGDADACLEAVCRRGGALADCAARLGVLAAGGTCAANVGKLGEFGAAIGAARRVNGDLAPFRRGGGDWERGPLAAKRNLAVRHALCTATCDARRSIQDICKKRVLDASDVLALAQALEENGSKAFAEEAVERLMNDAGAALARAGLDERSAARLRRLAGEFIQVPDE